MKQVPRLPKDLDYYNNELWFISTWQVILLVNLFCCTLHHHFGRTSVFLKQGVESKYNGKWINIKPAISEKE